MFRYQKKYWNVPDDQPVGRNLPAGLFSPALTPVMNGEITVTNAEYLKVLSALNIGAQIAYPDEYAALVDIWLDFASTLDAYIGDGTYYRMDAPFIKWYPANPFTTAGNQFLPQGQLFPAWFIFSLEYPQFFTDFLSWFGIEFASVGGYQVGDVLSTVVNMRVGNLTGNIFDWLFGNQSNSFIKVGFEIHVQGEGVLQLETLSVPNGGRVIWQVDTPINLLDVTGLQSTIDPNDDILETDKDIFSFPQEQDTEDLEEIVIEGAGNHIVYVQLLPVLNDQALFIGFGAGFRSVRLGEGLLPVNPDTQEVIESVESTSDFGTVMSIYGCAEVELCLESSPIISNIQSAITQNTADIAMLQSAVAQNTEDIANIDTTGGNAGGNVPILYEEVLETDGLFGSVNVEGYSAWFIELLVAQDGSAGSTTVRYIINGDETNSNYEASYAADTNWIGIMNTNAVALTGSYASIFAGGQKRGALENPVMHYEMVFQSNEAASPTSTHGWVIRKNNEIVTSIEIKPATGNFAAGSSMRVWTVAQGGQSGIEIFDFDGSNENYEIETDGLGQTAVIDFEARSGNGVYGYRDNAPQSGVFVRFDLPVVATVESVTFWAKCNILTDDTGANQAFYRCMLYDESDTLIGDINAYLTSELPPTLDTWQEFSFTPNVDNVKYVRVSCWIYSGSNSEQEMWLDDVSIAWRT